jgi:glycosyltransferase involved in cell wall biosynthesis
MSEHGEMLSKLGVIAIGRNENQRLRKCLESLGDIAGRVVYVDSGSTDGSVDVARAMYANVVELDAITPFTAARARNEGFKRLREIAPALVYVQFVDGDCEIVGGWLDNALRYLDKHADVGVVCGRRRERFREQNIYNLLCDMEWDTPAGEAKACGGDAMMRVDAFEKARGFRSDLIAGEEPELCFRLRALGWRIWRLDRDMTLHDAAMTRFSQWWKRTIRGGYAFAEGAYLYGTTPERYCVREMRRAWLWGVGVPLMAIGLTIVWGPWGSVVLAIYPFQVIYLGLREERTARENWWRALFLVLGKFPEVIGQVKYFCHLMAGSKPRLIEYK